MISHDCFYLHSFVVPHNNSPYPVYPQGAKFLGETRICAHADKLAYSRQLVQLIKVIEIVNCITLVKSSLCAFKNNILPLKINKCKRVIFCSSKKKKKKKKKTFCKHKYLHCTFFGFGIHGVADNLHGP